MAPASARHRVAPALVAPQPPVSTTTRRSAMSPPLRRVTAGHRGVDTYYNIQAFVFSLIILTVNVVHNDLHRAALALPLWSLLGVATALWLLLELLVCLVFFAHLAPLLQRQVVAGVHGLHACAAVVVLALQLAPLDMVVLWWGSLSCAFYCVDAIIWRELAVHNLLGLALLGTPARERE